jgi:hypothetical protein
MSQLMSAISRIIYRVSVDDVPVCRRACNLSTAADVSAAFPGVPLRTDSKTAFQHVPREDNSDKWSTSLASALKIECNSEATMKPSCQPDHMGEDFIWDPGTIKTQE